MDCVSYRKSAAHQYWKKGSSSDAFYLVDRCRVAGVISGRDSDVGVEKLNVSRLLLHWSVCNDRVSAMLYVHVGEDRDILRMEDCPVPEDFSTISLDERNAG